MRPLSSLNPAFYRLSVGLRRIQRHLIWRFGGLSYALHKSANPLEHSLVDHRSLLLRKLEGTHMTLQRNKVKSLEAACPKLNSVVISPGETFSFWKLVGRPSASRGFPPRAAVILRFSGFHGRRWIVSAFQSASLDGSSYSSYSTGETPSFH